MYRACSPATPRADLANRDRWGDIAKDPATHGKREGGDTGGDGKRGRSVEGVGNQTDHRAAEAEGEVEEHRQGADGMASLSVGSIVDDEREQRREEERLRNGKDRSAHVNAHGLGPHGEYGKAYGST